MERFVSKVCVLGLGFQMGAPKFQMTLAKGALGGPPVYFPLDRCKGIVNTYRAKNHKIVGGWEICKRIIEDMAVGRTGAHGPINWEFETIWLPNGMALKYPGLRKSVNEQGWDEWTYQAKDQRKKIYGGLLCLGAKTDVLTDHGWKAIIAVTLSDKLWDGTGWVGHSGLVHRGVKQTLNFGGVDMTPDHEVLVNYEWIAAKETTHYEATSSFTESFRAPYRPADRNGSGWQRRETNFLDGAMRLRASSDHGGHRSSQGQYEELRMLDGSVYSRITDNARYVEAPGLLSVAQYAGPLQAAYTSVMGALRRARDYGVRSLEQVRSILGRHGAYLSGGPGPGSPGELAGLQPGKLPLGNAPGQHPEHPRATADQHARRTNAALASSRGIGHWENDATLPAQSQLASEQDVRRPGRQKQDVFDLVDAGPLKRFTVRGDDGLPFIVHNCENLVQALARIIVAGQKLAISRKYRVVMTTHDEVVAIAKTAQAEACIKFMAKCMSTAPAWCLDIPLNCEGGWDVRYSK